MEKTYSRGHRLPTSPGRSPGLTEDGAGSDGTIGSRVRRAPQNREPCCASCWTPGGTAKASNYRWINWRYSRLPGRHGKQLRSRSLPRIRRIRITMPSQTQAQSAPKKNEWRPAAACHGISSASASCTILTDAEKHCAACAAGSASHRGRVERALRIHPGAADGRSRMSARNTPATAR